MDPEEPHLNAGHEALATGELETASKHYLEATRIAPTSFDAWHALGMVYYKLSRYPEAIEALKEAARITPSDPMAWTSLSLAYMRNHQIPEAEAAGGKAKIVSWGGIVEAPL